jgi:DNA processing protein
MKINRTTPDRHIYLQIIENIANKPKALYYIGTLPKARLPTVAIVGTRKPTAYGKEIAHQLAYELARQGIVVISGLALGIDGIAHRAALEAGGTTIAVLANSVERIYPRSHQALGEQIINEGGAIISEYEPPTDARAYQFLARNRIISGLSDAIVIVEAATRSGTLNTAAHALEQGKELFAVPGNITSPLSGGCNNLIKQGAMPVTSADDILAVLKPVQQLSQAVLALGDTPAEDTILGLLRAGMRDGDQLQQESNLPAAEFTQALTMLEINGVIRPLGANQWTVR